MCACLLSCRSIRLFAIGLVLLFHPHNVSDFLLLYIRVSLYSLISTTINNSQSLRYESIPSIYYTQPSTIHNKTSSKLAQRLSMSGGGDSHSHSSTSKQQQQSQQRSSLLEHVESGLNNTSANTTATNSNLSNNVNNSEEEQLSKEISRLLSSFTELLNTRMAPASERTGRSQHALLVKRYREILFDCGSDYYKTMEVVRRKKEARELMRGAAATTTANGEGDGGGMDHLLRERSSIDASLNSTNAILSQASSVRNELRNQGHNLRNVSGTMSVIAGHIPGLNGLIDKIRKKRLQDDRIVGGVVAGCILFTLWYLFG